MQASTWRAGVCIFEPEKILDDLSALKSMPSPEISTVVKAFGDEIALCCEVGLEKHPVADPIQPSDGIVIKSQKRPEMFGPNIAGSIYLRNGVTERTLWTFLGGSFKDNGTTEHDPIRRDGTIDRSSCFESQLFCA